MITVGELFAGIGGIGLGLERTGGFETKWQVEIDDYATRVLEKHWPNVKRHRDVRIFPPMRQTCVGPAWYRHDRESWYVDLICGGFPCTDISNAGKRAGIRGAQSGLFYEILRVARILRPEMLLLENVAALLHRGMGTVLGELSQIGFDAEWHCIPAASVGAPHIRDRVFIVAHARHAEPSGRNEIPEESRPRTGSGNQSRSELASCGSQRAMADAERYGCERARTSILGQDTGADGRDDISGGGEMANTGEQRQADNQGRPAPKRMDWSEGTLRDGRGTRANEQWSIEPAVGRVADGVPARVHRLRCLGNAVVPQVAELIGQAILAATSQTLGESS